MFCCPPDAPITWLGDSEVGIEECFAVYLKSRGPEAKELVDARELLKEMLAAGPVLTSEVLSQARVQGFYERTLRRAKKKLGVMARQSEHMGPWEWVLPDAEDEHSLDGQTE